MEHDLSSSGVEESQGGGVSSGKSSFSFSLIPKLSCLDLADSRRAGASNASGVNGGEKPSKGFVIHPENRWHRVWVNIILVWAVYSSVFTPLEFGFFRGLADNLVIPDIVTQVVFLLDIVCRFFVAYHDKHANKMVYKHTPIAIRYLKSSCVFDLLACLPWDSIYKAAGREEAVRYMLWIRLYRVRRITRFFKRQERNTRINYIFTRVVKLISVELYWTHTAACIFYYLATTLPPEKESNTWIGSLELGDYSYSNFRDIDLAKTYVTSLYFAIVTMTTVGFGDIHAVNLREMIFIMIYITYDMIITAYLIGNMTAMIVKGSRTEKFRDRMKELTTFMNRGNLGRDMRNQITGHVRLQYESNNTEAALLQDIPAFIRAEVAHNLYIPYLKNVPLLEDCSLEFINQLATGLQEEFFLPGEVIVEQGSVVDQLYFVCHGVLEEVEIRTDGSVEIVSVLKQNSSFCQVSIVCNIPQPHAVRVCELCRLLRLDKQSFVGILDTYFYDREKILKNLLKGRESHARIKQLASDITSYINQQDTELAVKLNNAAYNGDFYQLKRLLRTGADPNKKNYDGKSPLHLAASRGHEVITQFLIQEGADVNSKDGSGNTPLLEAVKNGHDGVSSLLAQEGASLGIDDPANIIHGAVVKGDSDFLKRLLTYGIDVNAKNYDYRTPLHVAASEGLYTTAKLLVESGASVLVKDRWGKTPHEDSHVNGNKKLIKLLEDAKKAQLSQFPASSLEVEDRIPRRKCTVFPFHPLQELDSDRHGVTLSVPGSIEELIKSVIEQTELQGSSFVLLSEDEGRVTDPDMIDDGQKLYIVKGTR